MSSCPSSRRNVSPKKGRAFTSAKPTCADHRAPPPHPATALARNDAAPRGNARPPPLYRPFSPQSSPGTHSLCRCDTHRSDAHRLPGSVQSWHAHVSPRCFRRGRNRGHAAPAIPLLDHPTALPGPRLTRTLHGPAPLVPSPHPAQPAHVLPLVRLPCLPPAAPEPERAHSLRRPPPAVGCANPTRLVHALRAARLLYLLIGAQALTPADSHCGPPPAAQ